MPPPPASPTDPPPGRRRDVSPDAPLTAELTDAVFQRYWRSGSLKYKDFRPLTTSGSAVLQTCHDINLNRRVVHKALHHDLTTDPIATARFVREARVTANINHPGTAAVYEIGRNRDGDIYFTMKHIRGVDLRHVFTNLTTGDADTRRDFPLQHRLNLLTEAARTLRYAHRSGVVHRDVKPANILAGVFGEATLLDFGLAQLLGPDVLPDADGLPPGEDQRGGDAAVSLQLTNAGGRIGTPLYMSPEQARGAPTDTRTDVYGWGTVLYEALTLKPLVFGDELEDVLAQVLDQPAPVPSAVADSTLAEPINPALDEVCLRCLAKDPNDRFADFGELLAALGQARSRRRIDPDR